MKTKTLIIWLLFCACFYACQTNKQPQQPNIVRIFADDLGFADLGFMGSDLHLTPNVDRLAAEGMYFDHAYSSHPICQPSRISIMTGKYPALIGAVSHGRLGGVAGSGNELPKEEVIIEEAMQKAGYVTAYLGKWSIGRGKNNPSTRGFDMDIASNQFCWRADYFFPFKTDKHGDAGDEAARIPGFEKSGDHLTDLLADEAVKLRAPLKTGFGLIRKRFCSETSCSRPGQFLEAPFINSHKEGSFFLNLSHFAVHTPLAAAKEKIEMPDRYKNHLELYNLEDNHATQRTAPPQSSFQRSRKAWAVKAI